MLFLKLSLTVHASAGGGWFPLIKNSEYMRQDSATTTTDFSFQEEPEMQRVSCIAQGGRGETGF